jgi:hypothetical protein
MSVWEFIGWMIAVPMAVFAALFVFAVIVAVVRVIAGGTKPTANNVTPIRSDRT